LSSITLSIDVHGGDFGFSNMMPAIAKVLHGSDLPFRLALCGKKEDIENSILEMRLEPFVDSGRIFIVDASQEIPAGESVSRIWRNFPDSSLVRSVSIQHEGLADATLSAGDTGALFAASVFVLGREEGVTRPALAATLPTETGKTVLLLDVGASLDCNPEHLLGFGTMGYSYMKRISRDASPKVGLLNVGTEAHKGTIKIRRANEMFEKECEGYIGYVEGGDMLRGNCSVVVCDGFIGNALLKNSESLFNFIKKQIAGSISGSASAKLDLFNSEIYGSVPILGLNGHVFKAHGGSSVNALSHAIATALKTVYLLREPEKA